MKLISSTPAATTEIIEPDWARWDSSDESGHLECRILQARKDIRHKVWEDSDGDRHSEETVRHHVFIFWTRRPGEKRWRNIAQCRVVRGEVIGLGRESASHILAELVRVKMGGGGRRKLKAVPKAERDGEGGSGWW